MNKDLDPALNLFNAFQKKGYLRTWAEITSSSGLSKKVAKPVLRLGKDSLFIRNDLGWNLAEDTNLIEIEKFKLEYANEIMSYINEWEIARSKKVKVRKVNGILSAQRRAKMLGQNQIMHGEGEDYTRNRSRQSGDGLTKGKVKLYKGPNGQYWTDPNFKKKEY